MGQLIDIVSDIRDAEACSKDVLGCVYQYFLSQFAGAEGKKGGEFYTHPWPIGTPYPKEIDGVPVGPRGSALFSTFVNAAALPAISVPVKPSASGIPVGMQLVGRYGADETLLRMAAHFESAQPWATRWPKIAGAA